MSFKAILGLLIMLICMVGVFYFRGVKMGVPWICKLIGRPDLIDANYYGPMFEMDENKKFHIREDDDEDDEEEEEISKY